MPLALLRHRHFRTIFLAVLATVCFVVAAIWQFDVSPWFLLQAMLVCIAVLLVIIFFAFITVWLWQLIRSKF